MRQSTTVQGIKGIHYSFKLDNFCLAKPEIAQFSMCNEGDLNKAKRTKHIYTY